MKLILLLILGFLFSCAELKDLKRLLPEKPVLSAKERTEVEKRTSETINYTTTPKVNFPVFPVQIWAATYSLDVILVSENPDWNMHEFAKLSTPNGDLWLMKDADNATLSQTIVAHVPDINTWLPEIPVQRKSYPVKATETIEGKHFKLHVEYENFKNEQVVADYFGKIPRTRQPKRNGSTMGHSRQDLIAVLDLPLRNFGKKSSISYSGKTTKIKRLLGLLPFQMALTQTQAGLSRRNYSIIQGSDNQHFMVDYNTAANQWTSRDSAQWTIVEQKDMFRTLRYFFLRCAGGRLELSHATARQWNSPTEESFCISFFPPLPDVRCVFSGTHHSDFIMDVGGQKNHAIGTIKTKWESDTTCVLDITPTQPWWVADRVTQTRVRYENPQKVQIQNQ